MLDTRPTVSVLVPVYNDAGHLGVALDSVLAQTHRDLEAIVSDDASTDGSAILARRYADRDPRVRVVVQPTNLGMTANWNAALRLAQGDFVCKLDSDDAWGPRFVEELLAALTAATTPMIAFSRTLQCDDQLRPVASYLGDSALIRRRIDPLAAHTKAGLEWYRMAFDDVQLWHSNAFLCPTGLLRDLNGWDESYGCASDTDLILRLLERDLPVRHVPYAGVLYRVRPASVSTTYRRSGLLTLESSIVHLRSLQRYRARSGRLDRGLRFAWQRYHEAFAANRARLDDPALWPTRGACDRLRAAAAEVTVPPPDVRARAALDHLRRRFKALVASTHTRAAAGPHR